MIHSYQKHHRKVLQILLVLLPLPCLPLKITAGLIRHYESWNSCQGSCHKPQGMNKKDGCPAGPKTLGKTRSSGICAHHSPAHLVLNQMLNGTCAQRPVPPSTASLLEWKCLQAFCPFFRSRFEVPLRGGGGMWQSRQARSISPFYPRWGLCFA